MWKTAVFFIYLLRTSIKASISKRGAFLIESGLMAANNLIFLSIWWIFFRRFDDIAGWKINDMIALTVVGTLSYGLMQVCFGGLRNLSRIILSGDLDPFMTQPKNLLIHLAGSRSLSKGWGQLMTGLILMIIGGLYSPLNLALLFISTISGCIVFTSISIIAHSLPFWMGSVEGLSKKYCEALYLFALYPTNIYSGLTQVIMFTLIPAGIIGYIPVELIRSFSWPFFILLAISPFIFLSVALFVFYSGLKRYESGNKFGTRL
jgi:ABC-2 type transport system permease protein